MKDDPKIQHLSSITHSGEPIVAPADPQISHAVLLTGAQVARAFFRLLFVVVSARVLGPNRFGVYAFLLATVEMSAVASGAGYTDYLTREAAKDACIGWGLFEQLTFLRVAYAIVFTAVLLAAFRLLGYSSFVIITALWISVTLLPRSLSETAQGVLRGLGRYVEFFVVELALGLTLFVGAIFLVLRHGGLREIIAIEICAALVAAFAAMLSVLKLRTKQRIHLTASQLIRRSSIFNIYGFVVNIYDRLDVLLLFKLAGDYATGVYTLAYRPISAIQLLPYGLLYSLMPALSREHDSVAETQRFEKAMGVLLSLAFVIVLATLAFADTAVRLVLGGGFVESALALKILIWAIIFRYVNFALNMKLLVAAQERVFVITSLVCLAVNLAANLIFIPRYSWRAAALVTIVTEVVLLLQNVYWLRRVTGSVPVPLGWIRVSLVFMVLSIAALAGARWVPPLAVGSLCLLLYLIYLYRTGIVGDFAAVWRAQHSPSV